MNRNQILLSLLAVTSAGITPLCVKGVQSKPNVLVILTDDQGYGDLSCTGNPWLKTPNIDFLAEQSTRLTDFHVSPCCAPTRASLLTGHYSDRTGCWHTVGGRSLLRVEETTLPEVLEKAGYETGMFGKWHLGDNYPFRPQDRGFQEALYIKGGGDGQLPDYWNNHYFNDTYFRNGKPEKFNDYCTDVWFDEAMKFMKDQVDRKKPFFTYLATNAPHGPYYVADKYSQKFKDLEGVVNPYFYGMIANIDENMGKLLKFLDQETIARNTIVIFLSDNGAANGSGFRLDRKTQFVTSGYNAGMRGGKISEYEGGHRVPCFIRWPDGGIKAGVDINDLTAHIDLFPTILDLLGIAPPDSVNFDGVSLKNRLTGNSKDEIVRTVVVDNQRVEMPIKYKNYSVMRQKWRLVNGKELYNISSDPGQHNNVAQNHLDIVKQLAKDYEAWWKDIKPVFAEYPAIDICPPQEPLTEIDVMDMHRDVDKTPIPWEQGHVRDGMMNLGWYAVNVLKSGNYRVKLYRYAPESGYSLGAACPAAKPEPGTNVKPYSEGKTLSIAKARFVCDGRSYETKVDPSLPSCELNVSLTKGFRRIRAEFVDSSKQSFAAYYFTLEKIEK